MVVFRELPASEQKRGSPVVDSLSNGGEVAFGLGGVRRRARRGASDDSCCTVVAGFQAGDVRLSGERSPDLRRVEATGADVRVVHVAKAAVAQPPVPPCKRLEDLVPLLQFLAGGLRLSAEPQLGVDGNAQDLDLSRRLALLLVVDGLALEAERGFRVDPAR